MPSLDEWHGPPGARQGYLEFGSVKTTGHARGKELIKTTLTTLSQFASVAQLRVDRTIS